MQVLFIFYQQYGRFFFFRHFPKNILLPVSISKRSRECSFYVLILQHPFISITLLNLLKNIITPFQEKELKQQRNYSLGVNDRSLQCPRYDLLRSFCKDTGQGLCPVFGG